MGPIDTNQIQLDCQGWAKLSIKSDHLYDAYNVHVVI
jgi:hypothetical protein